MAYMNIEKRPNAMITALTDRERKEIRAKRLKEKTPKTPARKARKNYVVENIVKDKSSAKHKGFIKMISVNGLPSIPLPEVADLYGFATVSIYKRLKDIESITIDGLDMFITYIPHKSKFTAKNIDGRKLSGSLQDVSKYTGYSEAHICTLSRHKEPNKLGWIIKKESMK